MNDGKNTLTIRLRHGLRTSMKATKSCLGYLRLLWEVYH